MSLKSTLFQTGLYFCALLFAPFCYGQPCQLAATYTSQPSICKATGSITLNVTNGSGNYNFTISSPTYNSTTSSNIIGGLQAGNYAIKIKDIVSGCLYNIDSVNVPGTYQDPRFQLSATDVTCLGSSNGSITVTNLQFGQGPFSFAIIAPSASGVGTMNSTGVFNNLIPGNYTIQLRDSCGGLQTRLITIANYNWSITATAVVKVGCDSADATLTLTDNHGNTNASGSTFNGFLYGYVRGPGDTVWYNNRTFRFYKGTNRTVNFVVKDPCGNVNASTWVDNSVPSVGASVSISNRQCATFTASITNPHNLTSPQYCLYDNSNVLITCNGSGVFPGLAYGSYCITIHDACYDTTFSRCFTAVQPTPNLTGVNITYSCNSFNVNINGNNISNGYYCLYDSHGSVIICDSTGVFTNLPFGNYCVHVHNDPACFDTTLITCFTASQQVPSISNTVGITNKTCSTFTATVNGQNNLTNPQFCLYDNSNNLIVCNNSGVFNNLAYGSYCIKMQNDPACFDTLITRCFTVGPTPVGINVNVNPSCTIGATDLRITLSNGVAPYIIKVYNQFGQLLSTTSTSSTTTNLTGLPVITPPASFKIVVSGGCGSLDSTNFTARASSLNRTINANSKCPTGQWLNGSGDLLVNAVFSEGNVTPKLVKLDGASINVNYSTRSGSNYTFLALAPGTYIIQYSLENCPNPVYDTFNLKAYQYPALNQSAVYQCDNNSFSVNANVSGGMAPLTYEIIGSVPTLPSIVAPSQGSSNFTINNGTSYSVIRLRATDGCGNATINDASILPLGNTVVTASSNCFYDNIVLSVDSIPNSTYTWYKKTSPTDSVLISSGQNYNITNLLPTDTGTYVSVVSVNGGCLTKVARFDINGLCSGALLAQSGLSFSGNLQGLNVQLTWSTQQGLGATEFVVERSSNGKDFLPVGNLAASLDNTNGASRYLYTDISAPAGNLYYRLKVIGVNHNYFLSRVLEFRIGRVAPLLVVPNPVSDAFAVKFQQVLAGNYSLGLVGADGRIFLQANYSIHGGETRSIRRPEGLASGVYFLVVTQLDTHTSSVFKLIFK